MDDELMSLDILSELQKMCEDGESVSGFDLKSLIDNSRAAHKLKERVDELNIALSEAMEWNWLEDEQPPKAVVDRCMEVLEKGND